MITQAPVYLDDTSLLNQKQILKINSMVKSQINLFTSKAVQKTKTDEVKNTVTSRSSAVNEMVENTYDGLFFVSMTVTPYEHLDLFGMEDVASFEAVGYFDQELTLPLSDYGRVSYTNGVFALDLDSLPPTNTLYLNVKGKKT